MQKSTTYSLAALAAAALAYALIPGRARLRAGQVAIITGGSRGLGLAIARRFGRAGLKLVLAARDQDELELARHQLLHEGDVANEDDILLVACDVSDVNQATGLVDQAIRTFGTLDVLINNAGIIQVGPVEDQTVETYQQTMQVNFFAALYTIYAALPHFLERHEGIIVNISSIGGKIPVPHLAPYTSAKFALTGFSEALHAELRHKGVRVTTVCPGLMRTGGENHAHFTGQVGKERQWFDLGARTPGIAASPEHAANRIFDAVNAGSAEITITPQAALAARVFGLAPATSQVIAALANHYILPDPLSTQEPVIDPSPS